ncbi:MAG: hypothetical protein J6K84_02315 [Oscillospiraceae bacterium]|nr:hypothetical protein [Oscillospiraceae bacterium]
MKEGQARNLARLHGINQTMHEDIVDDIFSRESLILEKLLNKFEKIKAETGRCEIDIKEIISFSMIRSKMINSDNARNTIKTVIHNKMNNLRAAPEEKCSKRTSFTIEELLAYCELLGKNPEAVLIQEAPAAFVLPVQYCNEDQVQLYLANAKKSEEIAYPIRIPLFSAPIVGVSMDAYFTASSRRTLEDQVAGCRPLEVGKSNLPKYNTSNTMSSRGEKVVQIKTVLTTNVFESNNNEGKDSERFVSHKSTNDGNDVNAYLRYTARRFLGKCKELYEERKKYMSNFDIFTSEDLLGRYCATDWSKALDNWIEKYSGEIQQTSRKEKYGKSSFELSKSDISSR